MSKIKTVVDNEEATKSGINVIGVTKWVTINKAYDKGRTWFKSTKALQLPNGVLIQTSNEQTNNNGSTSICDALVFVPDVQIEEYLTEDNKTICKLVKLVK